MTNNILVFGATSTIAFETCKLFAKEGKNLTLIARDQNKLESVKNDLLTRGAKSVKTFNQDLSQIENHQNLFKKIDAEKIDKKGIDLIFIAYGTLPNQEECNKNFETELNNFQVNFISTCSILNHYANYLEERYNKTKSSGSIAVITSVAGDRGRQSNYSYGTAKGALSIYLQGLRHRLYKSNINVLDIKPGFVDTPMTSEIKKNFLFASPKKIALRIHSSIDKNKTIYSPWFWRWVILGIKNIPSNIFIKSKL